MRFKKEKLSNLEGGKDTNDLQTISFFLNRFFTFCLKLILKHEMYVCVCVCVCALA